MVRSLSVEHETQAAAPQQDDGVLIRVEHLTKRFVRRSGAGVVIPVDDVSLEIRKGELLVLLGPSGCGKTTLLRCLAGLERPDTGEIRIRDEIVYSSERRIFRPPNERRVSMIFQSYALWPHMSIFENVAYPLRSRRTPKTEIGPRVREALATVGLGDLEKQFPGQLSGGQQQRVALARALVSDSTFILFDEPLSNVDFKVREQLREELVELQRRIGFTGVYVTHDQSEAMDLADRIAVLHNGRVEQLATPAEIYERPASRYVADFVGSANLLSSTVTRVSGDRVTVESPVGALEALAPDVPLRTGDRVTAMFRPQYLRVAEEAPVDGGIRGTTVAVKYLGTHSEHFVDAAGEMLKAWTYGRSEIAGGSPVWLSVEPRHVILLPETPSGDAEGGDR